MVYRKRHLLVTLRYCSCWFRRLRTFSEITLKCWLSELTRFRCHRIGQRHPVLIVRLVTADTIDETILQRAHIKRGLERLVLSSVSHSEISTPPSRESSSPSLRWKRLRNYLHDPQNTALGLSSVEIERLLCGKDYDKEVTQVEHISDDALHSLLNRSDLYMEWERLKSGESSRNTILCEPDLDYESNDVEHCGPPTVPPSSKFDPSNLSPLPSSCRNSKRRMTDYSGLLQSPSLNLTNSAPLSGNHVECTTTYNKDLQPFLSLPDSQTDFGWSPEP
ncbi:unnamed protein product [Dicrocoelium dendriticum]|nr:unnamed protein product [Dicrocoelium dendriticum]